MAELTNAMKGVIQSSTARTSSTYASTDLIQLYDSNNEPTIKINKDDLMAAVKASLPSLLSDQGTSGTAFPSIASGVLGSMTAANLASVLGVMQTQVYTTGANLFFSYVGCAYVLGVTDDYSQYGIWLAIVTGTGGVDKAVGVQQLSASSGVTVATNFMGTFAPSFSGSFKLYVTFMQ